MLPSFPLSFPDEDVLVHPPTHLPRRDRVAFVVLGLQRGIDSNAASRVTHPDDDDDEGEGGEERERDTTKGIRD